MRYIVTYDRPHSNSVDFRKEPILQHLSKKGYLEARLSLDKNYLSGTLTIGDEIADEDLRAICEIPTIVDIVLERSS